MSVTLQNSGFTTKMLRGRPEIATGFFELRKNVTNWMPIS